MRTVDWRRALTALAAIAAAAGAQTVWDGTADTTWYSASQNAFIINSAERLAGLAYLVNRGGGTGLRMNGKTFTLACEIALNNTEQQGWKNNPDVNYWEAIGDPAHPFQGNFDGGGFTVRGVYIVKDAYDHQGLFGYVNNMATIRKLRVAESSVEGNNYVGGLVGSDSGKIIDCYSTATVVGKGSYVGGLVGIMKNRGAITGSYATGDVSGASFVGGLAGAGETDTIKSSYATGNVLGSGNNVGGLAGMSSGYIINAYASGTVIGADSVGGLVGTGTANIANSYAAGNVSGKIGVGGLVGCKTGAAMKNSYASGLVTGTDDDATGGLVGTIDGNATVTYCYYDRSVNRALNRGLGTPKTTAYMQSADFVSLLNVAAYALKNNTYREITNKWFYSGTGQYPKLSIDTVSIDIFASCFAGGAGTESSPYLIKTPQHLKNLAVYVNCGADLSRAGTGFYKLSNNIVVNDTTVRTSGGWRNWAPGDTVLEEWTAIGQQPRDTVGQPPVRFNGVFDGGGFAVVGIYIDKGNDTTFAGRYQGLFGRVEKAGTQSGGVIKNLGVAGAYINGYCYVGGLAGWNNKGAIIKSYVRNANIEATGGVNGAGGIGGLVGKNDAGGIVINSYARATDVVGVVNIAGGLVGWNAAGSRVAYCYAQEDQGRGKVAVTGDDVGGLVGRNDNSTVRECFASVNVTGMGKTGASGIGGNVIGGLVGMNFNAVTTKCYATGIVTGNSGVGGLVGSRLSGGRSDSSYYKINANTVINDFGEARSDSLMKLESTYKGWNFATVWAQDPESKSYPYLGMVRAQPPTISQHPASAVVAVGATHNLSVTAAPNDGVLSYQWYSSTANRNKEGQKIDGATSPAYKVYTARDTLIYYYAVVTNTLTAAVPDSLAGSKTASLASNAARVIVGAPDAVLSSDRVIPNQPNEAVVTITPPSSSSSITAELTIGPNPAAKQLRGVNFYRQGNRVDNAVLLIYGADGNVVKRVRIVDNGDTGSTRKVGSWDLTDEKGRPVSEGTYLVRGEVVGKDGKRGRVSAVVGVR